MSAAKSRQTAVEAYRPATFEVTGKAKEARIVRRGNVNATVSANYLYGAPLRTDRADVVAGTHRTCQPGISPEPFNQSAIVRAATSCPAAVQCWSRAK